MIIGTLILIAVCVWLYMRLPDQYKDNLNGHRPFAELKKPNIELYKKYKGKGKLETFYKTRAGRTFACALYIALSDLEKEIKECREITDRGSFWDGHIKRLENKLSMYDSIKDDYEKNYCFDDSQLDDLETGKHPVR